MNCGRRFDPRSRPVVPPAAAPWSGSAPSRLISGPHVLPTAHDPSLANPARRSLCRTGIAPQTCAATPQDEPIKASDRLPSALLQHKNNQKHQLLPVPPPGPFSKNHPTHRIHSDPPHSNPITEGLAAVSFTERFHHPAGLCIPLFSRFCGPPADATFFSHNYF